MADCEKISKCPFYHDQMANMPANAAQMKETYCHGDKTNCARYLVASHGRPVPMDLFPNQVNRVRQILAH